MGRKVGALRGILVVKNDPESGAVSFVVARADGASELGEFEAGAAQQFGEDSASVIDEVAKPLGNEDGIDIARSRLFGLVEIVIGQRLFAGDFDSGGGPVLIGCNSN